VGNTTTFTCININLFVAVAFLRIGQSRPQKLESPVTGYALDSDWAIDIDVACSGERAFGFFGRTKPKFPTSSIGVFSRYDQNGL
jgi:hypothetical protein